MKKIVSALLVLSLCLTILPVPTLAAGAPDAAPAVNFTDVADGSYYSVPVQWAAKEQVTTGTSDNRFSPDKTCSRAEIITFLWRAVGSPEPETRSSFSDVTPDVYYAEAADWAKESGIVEGDLFHPDDPCTRKTAVEFIWKHAGSPKAYQSSFTDVSSEAVNWAVEQGITTGTSATTFSPNKTCTRAQIITFLYRGLAKNIEWKFLFLILPNTDISYTTDDGTKIEDKHSMTDKEVELIKGNAQLFANYLYEITDHVVYPVVSTKVVDTPITFEDLAPYGEDQYWVSASSARKFIPSSVNLDDYDNVTLFSDIKAETLKGANFWGAGGTNFGQSTSYSQIRHEDTSYTLYVFDEEQHWPPAVVVHEFLHFIERWSKSHGTPISVLLHDRDKLGYVKDPFWNWKDYYDDFIRHEIPMNGGYTAGVPCAIWRQPPHLFRQ